MTVAAGSAALAADMLVTMTSAGDSAPTTSVAWTGDISPTQIAANTDNYDPTGLSTAAVLRLTTDASRNITGLAGGADGRIVVIHNVGSFNIVLKDETTSTAANRFALSADVTLVPDNVCVLQYDSTTSRWRAFSAPTDLSAATAHIAASAAVHGLPASVNVLGNRSAAGESVQRGTITSLTTGGAMTFYQVYGDVVFAVAFSSTPIVVSGGTTTDVVHFAGAQAVTTTGFTYRRLSNTDAQAAANCGWVALGT